jgi:hypothetical protein
MPKTTARKTAQTELIAALDECYSYLNTPRRKQTPFVLTFASDQNERFRYLLMCKVSGRAWRDPGTVIEIPDRVRTRTLDALHTAYSAGVLINRSPGNKTSQLKFFTFAVHSLTGAYSLWNNEDPKIGHPSKQAITNVTFAAIREGQEQLAERKAA